MGNECNEMLLETFPLNRNYFGSMRTEINIGHILGVEPISSTTGAAKTIGEGRKKNMNLNPLSKFPFKA
jgi:hypothetical protein